MTIILILRLNERYAFAPKEAINFDDNRDIRHGGDEIVSPLK